MSLFHRARTASNLDPIAGVDLVVYARVSKGIAAFRYDKAKLPLVAAAYGVSRENWELAHAGWRNRIACDPTVSARFDQLQGA